MDGRQLHVTKIVRFDWSVVFESFWYTVQKTSTEQSTSSELFSAGFCRSLFIQVP